VQFDNGDMLKFYDGRILKLLEKIDPNTKLSIVQFIDRRDPTWMRLDESVMEINLGQSKEVIASFDTARGIHLRLNKMKGI
jgi:hypothetical protein